MLLSVEQILHNRHSLNALSGANFYTAVIKFKIDSHNSARRSLNLTEFFYVGAINVL